MKKKIAILGSTGSIGKTLINILKKDKKNFEIVLLSANTNLKEIVNQVNIFSVKNIIINDYKTFVKAKKILKKRKVKIHNNFNDLKNILENKKIDYVMSSITGLDGLVPTIKIIKFCKTIAIANKESIICAWDLIKKEIDKYNVSFVPVDSEHFSIWSLSSNNNKNNIKHIYITASGGPFINYKLSRFKKIRLKDALKHPNWSMGKKITIDSATMMNKVFEVIETQKIFNLPKSKIKILIHKKSYVHAIIQFNNGLKKILAHDTNMLIPIFNTIYDKDKKILNNKNLDIKSLNDLDFKLVNLKKFPLIKILKLIPEKNSLFETVLVSANDELVHLYLKNKIKYNDIQKKLMTFIKTKEILSYRNKKPNNINQIEQLNSQVRLKIRELCI